MDVIQIGPFSHTIIMSQKIDLHAERGPGILIKESSIKSIGEHRDSGKAQLIIFFSNLGTSADPVQADDQRINRPNQGGVQFLAGSVQQVRHAL
jgi:hypothetical protein